jgi:hypothetical protein
VGLLLAGATIGVVGATSVSTSDHGAWWTAVVACFATAIFVVVMWLGVHPFFEWGRGKTAQWRAASTTVVRDASPIKQGPLVVTSAFYGVHGNEIDVAERLNSLVSDGVLDFVVSNETMGSDPAPGIGKLLRLRWTFNGEPQSSAFIESTHVVIP